MNQPRVQSDTKTQVGIMRTAVLPAIVVVAIFAGCENAPRYGVVRFGYANGSQDLSGVDDASFSAWKKSGERPAVIHFRSSPGKFLNLGFMLKTPQGDVVLPEYFKDGHDREWRVAFNPSKKLLNPIIMIHQGEGDFDLYLLCAIKSDPSTDFVLTYSEDDLPTRTFKIVKAAIDIDNK